MKRAMITTVVLIFATVLAIAGDAQWQFDKNTASKMSAAELVTTADSLRSAKNYTEAGRFLQEAVRRQPKDAVLANKLGMVELQLKEYKSASTLFKKAIKLNPEYADALNNLGAVYFLQGNLHDAERYYRKALALDETRATFHVNLAATWERQNKLNLALTEYARALELNPDALNNSSANGVVAQLLTTEQRATRFFLLARVCAIRGDIEGAFEYLQKAKEESYRDMRSVYKQQEFAKLWADPRLTGLVPR